MTQQVDNSTARFHALGGGEFRPIAPLDLIGMVRLIWFGKYIITVCTLVAILSAGYYAFAIAKPRYAATTTLEITTPTMAPMNTGQAPSPAMTDPVHINTQVAILQSRHLMLQVVDRLDLTTDPEFNRYLTPIPPFSVTGLRNRVRNFLTGHDDTYPDSTAILEKTAQNLKNAITTKVLRDTYVFHITAETGNPAKSALVANTLAQVYLADQVAGRQAETETTLTWLSGKVAALQGQLRQQETAVNDLIAQANVLDAAMVDALSRQAQDTASRLAIARADLADAQAALQRWTAAQNTTATQDDPNRQTLAAAVDRHAGQVAALTGFKASLTRQLDAHSTGSVRLQQLRRETEATRVIYETFLRRLQETNMQRGLQSTDSRVLATASPGAYVAPRKLLIIAAAALLGALAGVGFVVLRDMLRRGFSDAASLTAATGLPVLAQFAPMRGRAAANDAQQRPQPAVRRLHTALLLQDNRPASQVVMFTASIHGEGKTANARAFVRHLADLGKSVMLIAADPCSDKSGQRSQNGEMADLAAVLAGCTTIRDALITDSQLGADVLAVDRNQRGMADMYAGAAIGEFFGQLRELYDFIVVDAPPVLSVPESLLLARHADAVLYSVRWNKTPRHLVLAGCDALARANVAITGLLLVQVDARRMRQYGDRQLANDGQPFRQNQGLITSISNAPTAADTHWRDHHNVPSAPR